MRERRTNDPGPDLSIGRLELSLPASIGRRADALARRAIAELARQPIPGGLRLERLDVPPLDFRAGETDVGLARRIADAIRDGILHHEKQKEVKP